MASRNVRISNFLRSKTSSSRSKYYGCKGVTLEDPVTIDIFRSSGIFAPGGGIPQPERKRLTGNKAFNHTFGVIVVSPSRKTNGITSICHSTKTGTNSSRRKDTDDVSCTQLITAKSSIINEHGHVVVSLSKCPVKIYRLRLETD